MRSTEANFLQFLKKSEQFVIPVFQRPYSCTREECRRLWDEIMHAGNNEKVASCFLGTMVRVEGPIPLRLTDSQQRFVTIVMLLEALARALGNEETVDGFSAKKLRDCYLTNPQQEGGRRYKLLLGEPDRATLGALLDQQGLPDGHSLHVAAAFGLLSELIEGLEGDLSSLCLGLKKLVILDVTLDGDLEDPQALFRKMNSAGRKLSRGAAAK
jgi:uncharacterized protein with ParB-like and HNH nuclease domain